MLFRSKEDGYDWFVACVFMMTGGDYNTASAFLKTMFSGDCFAVHFLWHQFSALHYSESFQLASIGCCVEAIMQTELPVLAALLKSEKMPVGVVLDIWLRQSFLNFLDFNEIKHFILFAILYGADYIVYFCVSVLRHLQEHLFDQESQASINLFQRIMTQPIDGFHSGDYLPFMDSLSTKHKTKILSLLKERLNK